MLNLFLADLKMLYRNRQSIFWALMFPLMFTIIFGFFFGKNTTVGTIGIINKSNSEIANNLVSAISDSGVFKVQAGIEDASAAKDQIKKSKISAALLIPENFGALTPGSPTAVNLIVDPGNAQVNSVLEGVVSQFLTGATLKVNNVKEPIFSFVEEKTSERKLGYFDFVLSGILGLALMNASIIGISVSMAFYRENQILKRITTTPLKTWWFIVDEVLSRLVLNVFQVSLILLVGVGFFGAHIYGNYFVLYALALLGAILFQLIGFVVASLTKTTDAAQGMATAITIPMMFLGGVFFPIDSLPKWLFAVVQYLPIAPLLKLIRQTALEGISPFDNLNYLGIILAWIVGALVFSSLKFRLAEE